jgi:hypothetical protein
MKTFGTREGCGKEGVLYNGRVRYKGRVRETVGFPLSVLSSDSTHRGI